MDETRVVGAAANREDELVEASIRPKSLDEYLGQQKKLVPPMDLSDVAFDAFLMNGQRRLRLAGKPGQTTRLRLVNAAAATYLMSGRMVRIIRM